MFGAPVVEVDGNEVDDDDVGMKVVLVVAAVEAIVDALAELGVDVLVGLAADVLVAAIVDVLVWRVVDILAGPAVDRCIGIGAPVVGLVSSLLTCQSILKTKTTSKTTQGSSFCSSREP